MKKEEVIYIIFRVYRNDRLKNFEYAWTKNKNMAKAFKAQRTDEKFKVARVTSEDLARIYSDTTMERERELKIKAVFCKSTNDYVRLVTTDMEMNDAKAKLKKLFAELSDPSRNLGVYSLESQMNLYRSIRPEFLRALEYFGFRPPAMDSYFDSVEDDYSSFPSEEDMFYCFGHDLTPDWLKCLCSLEGLVFALKEDM